MTNQPQTININGTEYTEDQLSDQQKILINHIADLNGKISTTEFSLDQLRVAREAFVNMLTSSLAETTENKDD